jgi:hypothetical protein
MPQPTRDSRLVRRPRKGYLKYKMAPLCFIACIRKSSFNITPSSISEKDRRPGEISDQGGWLSPMNSLDLFSVRALMQAMQQMGGRRHDLVYVHPALVSRASQQRKAALRKAPQRKGYASSNFWISRAVLGNLKGFNIPIPRSFLKLVAESSPSPEMRSAILRFKSSGLRSVSYKVTKFCNLACRASVTSRDPVPWFMEGWMYFTNSLTTLSAHRMRRPSRVSLLM